MVLELVRVQEPVLELEPELELVREHLVVEQEQVLRVVTGILVQVQEHLVVAQVQVQAQAQAQLTPAVAVPVLVLVVAHLEAVQVAAAVQVVNYSNYSKTKNPVESTGFFCFKPNH